MVNRTGLRAKFTQLADQLTRCQKSLNEFLEEKRSVFPRFYFIGDDDLLEILGQSTDPAVIQVHLSLHQHMVLNAAESIRCPFVVDAFEEALCWHSHSRFRKQEHGCQ